MCQQEGWLSGGRLDDDTIAVGGKPDFPVASFGYIRYAGGECSLLDIGEARYFVVEESLAGLAGVQGAAVWVQSQPEILAVGGKDGIYVVDGELGVAFVKIPQLEHRRLGIYLQDTVVLRAEPNVALSVGGDIVVEVEWIIADGTVSLPLCVRNIFFQIAHAFSCACPERFCHRVVHNLVKGIKMVGAVRVLVCSRLLHIARIVQSHHAIAPGSHPQTMVLVKEERVGRVGGVELGIAIHGMGLALESHESRRPGADE